MGATKPGRSRRTEIAPTIRAPCSFRDTQRFASKFENRLPVANPLMFRPGLISAALLILLLAGLVGAALITRYRYYDVLLAGSLALGKGISDRNRTRVYPAPLRDSVDQADAPIWKLLNLP